jgi:predicted glutamine amidotransferase
MCRLFGMHAGVEQVDATFWLLDAPDSLAAQSHRNPDGFGIGAFGANESPHVEKAPLPAWRDTEFATAAHDLRGTTFVAHVRHASTGALTLANTHPFLQEGRLFAHNGVVEGLDELDARVSALGAGDLVEGDTDSERVFALITAETDRHQGDVETGIRAATTWIAENLPVYSLNFVLTTATDIWALRFPLSNTLFILERPGGGNGADASDNELDVRGSALAAHSSSLATRSAVIVASEVMDSDPAWRTVESGELIHISRDLWVRRTQLFGQGRGLSHPLSLADLKPEVAASQHAG